MISGLGLITLDYHAETPGEHILGVRFTRGEAQSSDKPNVCAMVDRFFTNEDLPVNPVARSTEYLELEIHKETGTVKRWVNEVRLTETTTLTKEQLTELVGTLYDERH